VNVTIKCPCPATSDGTPRHESDTVTLKDSLTFRERLALRQTIKWAKETDEDSTEGELLAALTEGYVLGCIVSWTLVDEKGKALPPSRANIRDFLEAHDEQAMAVADAADDLYSTVVLLPLLVQASTSSPPSPTERSTSPKSNGQRHPKPSRQSSTSTTPMAVTGPMPTSPAGASN